MTFEEYKNQIQHIELSDYTKLLNMGRKWNTIDAKLQSDIKVGIIGSTSLQLIASVMKVLFFKYNINADIYEGKYNGISMDVFDENSALYKFKPSYVIIIPDYRDIYFQSPKILEEFSEVEKIVENVVQYYIKICNKIHDKLPGCQILLSNFVEPIEDSLGNLGVNYLFSQSQFYRLVNLELVKQRKVFITIVDIEKLAANIGKSRWFDESSYFLNKSGFALENIGFFCNAFVRQFESFIGRLRKCIILDLDNTLWGGVVGDLGYDGIMLDPNDAQGEAYLHFQRYLLSLKNRGIILAVCSKNDEKNAKEPFEKNKNMVLKLADISSFVANWNDKASNIKAIAKELNIGLDSIVFFDDNPTERELVKEFIPEVKVIDVPNDPAYYARILDQSYCFEWSQITKEDIDRVKSYSDNKERAELLTICENYDEFLKKLEMQVSWEKVTHSSLPRFSQLTNKTNQFNLRTCRYSESEIEEMQNSDVYELYTVSLNDKFSHYGIIACVILRFEKDICSIENWVMSCRVLKKTVENYTIYKIIDAAKKRGCKKIKAEFLQSNKNGMVSNLYDDLGFECIAVSQNSKAYILDGCKLADYQSTYIMSEV